MEALLSGDFDDDDDDDDESFEEDEEGNDDDDDDDDEHAPAEEEPAPVKNLRLPLHAHACAGKVELLTEVIGEGALTGKCTIGQLPDGTPRTIVFDLNHANEQCEPPLHAALLAAAEALALGAAPTDDPWVRAAAREDTRLLGSSVASPLASGDSPSAPVDAVAEARLACVRLLLEAGAEPERKVYGRTALHLACACAALPVLADFASQAATLLVACGAALTAVDSCGKTPLHYAAVSAGRSSTKPGWTSVGRGEVGGWMARCPAGGASVDR